MNLKLNRKILNVILFLLILVSGMTLLAKIYGLSKSFPHKPVILYLFILIIIIVSLIQLLINFQIEEKQTVQKNEPENKTEESDDQKNIDAEKIIEEKTEKESLNTKEILNRIIPNKLPTIEEYSETILLNVSKEVEIVQGIFYVRNLSENTFSSVSYYAYFSENKPEPFKEGESIPGQVARNKEIMEIDNVPENYIQVISGLGEGSPKYLTLFPVIKDDITIAIYEFASFTKLTEEYVSLLKDMAAKTTTNIYNYIKVTDNTKNDK